MILKTERRINFIFFCITWEENHVEPSNEASIVGPGNIIVKRIAPVIPQAVVHLYQVQAVGDEIGEVFPLPGIVPVAIYSAA